MPEKSTIEKLVQWIEVYWGLTKKRFKRFNWLAFGIIAMMHFVSLLAPFFCDWIAVGTFLFLYWLTGDIGVTLGFHRLLTHRSFETPKWLEYTLTVIGCLALQDSPARWVGNHRVHHKHSDQEKDPHTPNHGFNWAHVFWLFWENGENIFAARDLMKDPFHRWLNRWFWVPQVVLGLVLFFGGWAANSFGVPTSGISLVVWGIGVRTAFVYHVTWFVNSASHTWGYQNYQTGDRSKNLWWVALLAYGEGWHNNHHKYPTSAKHGLKWWEIDMTYMVIQLLSWLRLAKNVKFPPEHQTS